MESKPIQGRTTVRRLKGSLNRHRIPLTRIAQECGVGLTTVSHVLAGRRKSKNVIDTAKRLIQEAKARQPECAA